MAHGYVDGLACVSREVYLKVVPLVLAEILHFLRRHHHGEVFRVGVALLADEHGDAVQVVNSG